MGAYPYFGLNNKIQSTWFNRKKQVVWILLLIGFLSFGLYSHEADAAPANNSDELIRDFVTRFYQECLNREPDAAGLDGWVNSLKDGTSTGSDVAYGFVFSPEFVARNTADEEYLTILYRAFFDRNPDQAGMQAWLEALNSGTPREDVLNGFIYSQEFENLCNRFGINPYPTDTKQDDPVAAFVTRFYQECLSREPDTAGLEGWVASLKDGTYTGADVAYGFVFSPEFVAQNTSNEAFLTVLYRAFFDREPDQAGMQSWLAKLNAGTSREEVLNGFVYSQEFVNLCNKFGITPYDDSLTGSHVGRFSTYEGTKTCLTCHETEALQVHDSVHYQWTGDASEAIGLDSLEAGKLGGINDFCIYPDINWIGMLTNVDGQQVDGGCAKCHVGLGAKPSPDASQSQLENIDCLVCHSDLYKRTVAQVDGQFKFVPDTTKMSVSVMQAAVDITRPSKDSCLNCHTKAGGGNNFKRGDIEEAHRDPTRNFDVHMASAANGGAGLNCLDCHTSVSHKIAGRGTDLRPRELPDEVNCTQCHSETPHGARNIDKHTARVNCTVCHIPYFAKDAATDMDRDWSQPGDPVAATGLFEPSHVKGINVVPEYRFFNGTSSFYQFGEAAVAGSNGRIVMSAPVGNINDPGAKIYAFKHHLATQPIDPQTRRLLPLKIGKFFESGQIDTAVALGAESVGWNYSGHEFARTERFLGLFHEVAPKEEALSCNSCHAGGTRLDFVGLGYSPKSKYNGKSLCSSCHEDESGEWSGTEYFTNVHQKHVTDKGYDCSVCHTFSAAR